MIQAQAAKRRTVSIRAGEVLDLAVAVGVFVVGGFIGEMDGHESNDSGHEVQAGVGGLGQRYRGFPS